MNELEIETTIAALHTLVAGLETLRHMQQTEPALPDQQQQYANVLEDAFATLARIETTVDELRQELEYQHERLGKLIDSDKEEV